MKLDRSESRFIDYVFSAEASREAILIEIKTPTTPLVGSEYRGNLPRLLFLMIEPEWSKNQAAR